MSLAEIEEQAIDLAKSEIVGAETVHLDCPFAPCYAVVSLWPNGDREMNYAGSNWQDAQEVCAEINNRVWRMRRE